MILDFILVDPPDTLVQDVPLITPSYAKWTFSIVVVLISKNEFVKNLAR